jgi:hypothetical protein
MMTGISKSGAKLIPALLMLGTLGVAGCATNPYPAYGGYAPPPGSVTPTIPYQYAPGYYSGPQPYPYIYAYGYYGYWPGYVWYPGYWNAAAPIITGVTPTAPKPAPPMSGPPPAAPPVHRFPRPVIRPCVTEHTRYGTTTRCP